MLLFDADRICLPSAGIMTRMAKKTKTALNDLITALEKHVATLEDSKSSRGKRDRATERVRTAAIHYSSVLHSRTGSASPFLDIPDPKLDESTVKSLKAEKDALVAKRSAKHSAPAAKADAPDDAAPADAAADKA